MVCAIMCSGPTPRASARAWTTVTTLPVSSRASSGASRESRGPSCTSSPTPWPRPWPKRSPWNPPYFPGYEDLWDNIFLGRLASHPWGGMRFMAAFIGAGILDRYPSLRMGVLECGFGWLPFWAKRMDEQAVYVGGVAPLKHAPSEYLTSGRFFCTIERHEGEDMFNHVTSVLGDDVLMYASDYPHSECQFPNSVDNILKWKSLKPDARRKLLWDNAARFYKHT